MPQFVPHPLFVSSNMRTINTSAGLRDVAINQLQKAHDWKITTIWETQLEWIFIP